MDVIRDFDPWGDPLCTCPKKYGFNPYTGCPYRCRYCYITSYIPRAFECRPKINLIARVERDLRRVDKRRVISMSNSSDPYPPQEKKMKLTRSCLKIFSRYGCRLLVVTKSDLVTRDADLLKRMHSAVSITVTTLDLELSRKLEPNAPSPQRRLKAMEKLAGKNIPVALRLDPIFPFLNEVVEDVVQTAAERGTEHVTSSTFKPRPDSWRRMSETFPEIMKKLKPLYFRWGKKHHNCWYLPTSIRRRLMNRVRVASEKFGLTFAPCREGFNELITAPSCDGSHLIRNHRVISGPSPSPCTTGKNQVPRGSNQLSLRFPSASVR